MESNNKQIGSDGEMAARAYLENKGLRFIAANFSTRAGEIDLIMDDGRTLVFVEVKRRQTFSHGSPEESVLPWKQNRMVRAAVTYLSRFGIRDRSVRFDVVGVDGNDVRHVPNAFRLEESRYYY